MPPLHSPHPPLPDPKQATVQSYVSHNRHAWEACKDLSRSKYADAVCLWDLRRILVKLVQHSQAFFVRADLTSPEVLVRDYGYHKTG